MKLPCKKLSILITFIMRLFILLFVLFTANLSAQYVPTSLAPRPGAIDYIVAFEDGSRSFNNHEMPFDSIRGYLGDDKQEFAQWIKEGIKAAYPDRKIVWVSMQIQTVDMTNELYLQAAPSWFIESRGKLYYE